MRWKILLILVLFFALTSNNLLSAQDSISNPSESSKPNASEEFAGEEFDCRFTLGKIQGSHKCRINVTQQKLSIKVENEIIEVAIDHIFGLNSTIVTWEIQYNGNVYKGKKWYSIFINFLISPDPSTGNRTNFLTASTSRRERMSFLIQGIRSESGKFRKISLDQIVTSRTSTPVDPLQASKLASQLVKTKTCIRCDLRSANLEDADLAQTNLEGANLEGANLSRANLKSAYLVGAILDQVKIDKANLDQTMLTRSSMVKVNLEGSKVYGNLQGANLANAVLHAARVWGDLSYVNLSNADLSDAVLSGANLENANLENANLQGAKLRTTQGKVVQTILSGANLRGANLSRADLEDADLVSANLQGANLTNANLRYTKLNLANLKGANITNVNLSKAKLCGATMPDGTVYAQGCGNNP